MTDGAKGEVVAAERTWVELYVRNDAERFAPLLTDDFLYTSPTGEVVERAAYLRNLAERVVVVSRVEPSDVRVRFYAGAAAGVVTATWTVAESYRGTPFEGPCRINRLWVRGGDGRWRAATFQVTAVDGKEA